MYLRIFVRGELRIALGYVRYGGFAYNEDSAILVSGPKLKHSVVPKAYINQRSLKSHPPAAFSHVLERAYRDPCGTATIATITALRAQTSDGDQRIAKLYSDFQHPIC